MNEKAGLRATLSPEGVIRMEGEAIWVRRVVGAKMGRDRVWTMPATLDTCQELRRHGVAFSETLEAIERQMTKVQKYTDGVKKCANVEPLQPIPIKAPYTLYQHQVKAYNIALALFGRGAKKGGSDAKVDGSHM